MVFRALVDAGRFPLVEIIHWEFKGLAVSVEARVDLAATKAETVKAFSANAFNTCWSAGS